MRQVLRTLVVLLAAAAAPASSALAQAHWQVRSIDAGMNREDAADFGRALELVMGNDPITIHGSVDEQIGAEIDRDPNTTVIVAHDAEAAIADGVKRYQPSMNRAAR